MFEEIIKLLERAWDFIKKVFVKVIDFFDNILNFFESKYNEIILKHPKAKAVSIKIKDDLASGNYNSVSLSKGKIINTFYDEATGEIIEEATEVISYESLDGQTKEQFGDKDMLVIEN